MKRKKVFYMNVKRNLLASLLFAGSLTAQPQGFHLAGGDASAPVLDAQGNMVIQSGSNAIVNWDSFSITAAEQIHFQQQGSNSSVLNRVIGSQGSDLLGLLTSNGRVFLINPNGVFIGPGGRIETADFLASTFDILDIDFLQEHDLMFCGDSANTIQNLGTISCPTGNIHLFAAQVINEGELQASQGQVLLAAGGDILLQKDGSSHIYIRPELTQEELDGAAIDNKGSIEAIVVSLQAGASPYARAIRSSGTIDATTVQEIGGEIYLVAQKGITEIDGGALMAAGGTVHVLGEKVGLQNETRIDVSAPSGNGTVLIGGDFQGKNPEIQNAAFTYVSKESEVKADALENGNGGKVIVWSDEMTFAYGNISARGGEQAGDGGFVEVSGAYLDYQCLADRRAPQGVAGTLLLDPVNITITTANANVTPGSNYSYTGTFPGCPTATISATTGADNLVDNLNLGSVTINTSMSGVDGCASAGTITVSSPIGTAGTPWNMPTTLTLIADSNIIISPATATITNTSTTTTPFDAMVFTANGTGSTTTGISVGASLTCPDGPGNILLTGKGGNVLLLTPVVGVDVGEAITTLGSVTIMGTGGTTADTTINAANGVIVGGAITAGTATTAASITITGMEGSQPERGSGVLVISGIVLHGTGDITFNDCVGSTSPGVPNGFIDAAIQITGSCTASTGTIIFSNCQGGTNNGQNTCINLEPGNLTAENITFSNCVGGSGGVVNNFGVFFNTTTVTAVNNITMTNIQAGPTGTNSFGVSISRATLKTTSGDIAITSSGGSLSGDSIGIVCSGTDTIQAGGNGTIVLNGTGLTEGLFLADTTINTVNGDISITGSVVLGGAINIQANGTGSISFSSTIDGAFPLPLIAGESITVAGAVGSISPPTSITLTAPNSFISFGSTVDTSGALMATNIGGSATFSGAVGSISPPSSIDVSSTNSSVSFGGTVDDTGILSVNAAKSITFSGAIGSHTSPTSLTAQPGSGFSMSPSLGTVPNGTVTFGGPSVIIAGPISVSAIGRAIPMSIATIIGTGNLTVTSSSFTMGVNESMTVLGNLSIDGALSLSDIVAAGTMNLTGSTIALNPQPPALYLGLGGFFYTSPNAHIIAQNTPVVSPAVTPAGSRVLASGFASEALFLQQLKFGTTVLNYDIHNFLFPAAHAAINQLVVANSQVIANGQGWGLLPILDLRFFPVYAICPVDVYKEDMVCETEVFIPFIFESDIVDGNIFRSL